jgi:hypothetical protein
MFYEETVKHQSKYLYIQHHGIGDVSWKYRSLLERYNPLRYSICIRADKLGGSRWYINKNAKWNSRLDNFNWWLWKKKYRKIFGYPKRK